MAIIFEWDSKETVKRKKRTVEIYRRLKEIELLKLKNMPYKKKEVKNLTKELEVIEFELKHPYLYEK